jgi:hypothetical protein
MSLAINKTTKKKAVRLRTQKESIMRAIHHTPAGRHGSEEHVSLIQRLSDRVSHLSEGIWLCTTFLLFILMGPFSVIAVVYGLWALASSEYKEKMAEPARCRI